ncbi:MFS transporter [soil metagenome]
MSQAAVSSATPSMGRARTALILLILINLFNYIDRQVLPAVLEAVEKSLLTDKEAKPTVETESPTNGDPAPKEAESSHKTKLGLLQVAFMFSYFLCAPLFGWLADRMPRWKIIGVGVILWSLASGASGLAATFTLLFLTRCAVGLGEAAYGPAAPTIISDLYPISVRGKVMSWFYVAIPVGSALGSVLGGQVLSHTLGNEEGWRWELYLVMPPGILLGLWCFFMKEPARGQADRAGTPQKKATWEDFRVLVRTPSYVLCTLGMTAMTFAMGGIAYWLPYYLIKVHGMEPKSANSYFGLIVVLTGLFATLLGGILGDRLRKRFSGSYFLVSGIAMLVGFPLIALVLVAKGPLLWVCISLACFALFFNTGPTNTILANVTHPQIRASAFAINIFVIHALGDAVSPAIIGAITDSYGTEQAQLEAGLRAGFLTMSAFVALGGILWLWGMRYLAKDTAAVSGDITPA